MKKIQLATETKRVEAIVRDLENLLGIKSLSVKYEPPIVFDINHLGIRSPIALLGFIYAQFKIPPPSTFKKNFRMRLKSFPQFFNSEKYNEYLEKCVTVLLLSQIITTWDDIKEEQSINGKILDVAFLKDTDAIFVEISRITLNFYLDLLKRYNRDYFSKIVNRNLNPTPLYYEVVFTQEPAEETINRVVAKLEELMKANNFPTTVEIDEDCEIYIDKREARSKEKQLIREKLNSMSFLKSTTLNGIEGKFYTLAYQFDYKSIENKISEEMKHHALDKLNNIWVSLHVPIELLNELESDEEKETRLRDFIGRFTWLQGLLLFNISLGSVSELSYIVVSQ